MKKTLAALGMMCLFTAVSFASTITGYAGSSSGVGFSGFDNGVEKGSDLAGAVAFVGGDGCTFLTVGSITTCTGVGFTITVPTNANTGGWDIMNTGGDGVISSLTLNLQPSNSVFHVCLDGSSNITAGNCAHNGGTISSVSPLTPVSANAAYTNLATDLLTGMAHPFSPLYGEVTFTFGSTFIVGQDFSFSGNTDSFAGASAPTPEPETYAMVGIALAGFGMLGLRRRKAARVK